MGFWVSQFTLVCVYIVLVSSYDVVASRAGLLSLAHAALFGVGAYTSAFLLLHTPISDVVVLAVLSGIAAAVVSLPIAVLSLRIRREYFSVTSLGFAFAFIAVLDNVPAFGLAEGLIGIPVPRLGPWELADPLAALALAAGVAALVVFGLVRLIRSKWGLRMEAVRDSERAAVSFGINPTAMRTAAVVLAGAGAGVAGTLYVVYAEFVSPDTFDLGTLALIVAMLGLGQMFGEVGYVVGPLVLVSVSGALQYLHLVSLTVLGPINQIIYGLVMVFGVVLVPRGFGRARFDRPRRREATAPPPQWESS
jgi:branched-chain amino acid transport system permease protein